MFALGAAVLVATLAYAMVFVAQSEVLDPGSLAWGGFFCLLMVGAHLAVRRWAAAADPYLLPATALLCGIGATMIYRLDPDNASRQTTWLVIGVAAFALLLARLPDHRVLEHYKYLIGAGSVLALALLVTPLGYNVRGARLWLDLGPVGIQPGEFAKIGLVIFLAAYLRENRELLGRGFSPKHLGPLLLFWGAGLGLLVVLNDFGTSLLFYGTFLLMLYVATGRLGYMLVGLGAFLAASLAVYRLVPHVADRFEVWLDPWTDERGGGYQLVQGLYALADGGLFGRGLGQGYLVGENGNTIIPDAHTDFIFAAVADELGFVGAVGILLVYVVVSWRGFAIASRCHDGFSKLLAFGLAAVFAAQSIIIVGGVVRMLPLTGQTLPFISYGGSSVLANFLVIALLLRISHQSETTGRTA